MPDQHNQAEGERPMTRGEKLMRRWFGSMRFEGPGWNAFFLMLGFVLAVGGVWLTISDAIGAERPTPVETPSLAEMVSSGALAPVADRLPADPFVVSLDEPGRHGGVVDTLVGRAKDIRLMVVYGYARLICYDENLELQPDIARAVDVSEGRQFTIHLRAGHKWSDGAPFTAEDFRYYWEDMATDKTISPLGPDSFLIVDGELPTFEVIDPLTVRYTWSKPNPFFLSKLAAPRPPFIYRPAHYLKTFHATYADADALAKMVADAKQRDWRALHFKKDRPYRSDNIDYPTLQPWRNTTAPPSERFVFKRNPYYHRMDAAGHQLPYLDAINVNVTSGSLIPAKVGTGDVDFQARGLEFKNYTFLKQGEARNDYAVRLWSTGLGAQMALFPNMHAADPTWRALLRDVRFRRALSMGIDRDEINQVIFFGLARMSQNTVLEESPLFNPDYASAYAEYDIAAANALLDEIGLTRGDGGTRLMPNGEKLDLIVETAGEDSEETDALQLIKDSYAKLGIRLYVNPSRREVLRDRVKAGTTVMSIFSGLDNGLATPTFAPVEFVPTNEDQLQWPLWGRSLATQGQAGEAPDTPEGVKLVSHYEEWKAATSDTEREAAWQAILKLHAEQVFSIGILNAVPQPVVISNKLRGVPEQGLYNWDPGAHFGIYRPDRFWLDAGQ